jgi:TRAP-type C4-dicarboxylate transport system substrate-binding protein
MRRKCSATSLLVVASFVLLLCAGSASAQPAKPIIWKLVDYDSQAGNTAYGENLFDWWAKEVNKRTGGRMQVQVFHSEMLVKTPDFLTALDTGLADIAHVPIPAFPGRFPITEFLTDTPICYGDARLIGAVLAKLLEKGLLKEYEPYTNAGNIFAGAMCIFTTKKKISKLEDLKGLKLRTRGTPSSRLTENLGATPVSLGNADIYTGLERGTIDGIITSMTYVEYAKLYEVMRFFLDQGLTGGIRIMLAGNRQWNSLPPDIQKIILQLGQEISTRYTEGSAIEAQKGRKVFTDKGGTIYKLDPAEWARMKKVMDSTVESLSGGLAAKGVPWAKVKETIDAVKAGYKE